MRKTESKENKKEKKKIKIRDKELVV